MALSLFNYKILDGDNLDDNRSGRVTHMNGYNNIWLGVGLYRQQALNWLKIRGFFVLTLFLLVQATKFDELVKVAGLGCT